MGEFGLRGVLGAQRVALRAAREMESCVVICGAGSAGVGKCRGAHQKFADADHPPTRVEFWEENR